MSSGRGWGREACQMEQGQIIFVVVLFCSVFINLFIQRLLIIIDQAIKYLLHIHPMFVFVLVYIIIVNEQE